MNTVVCVKQGPDTAAERALRLADGTLDRESPDRLINELDESATEDGLKIAEAHGSEVTIASMGPGKTSGSSTSPNSSSAPVKLREEKADVPGDTRTRSE